MNQIKLGTRSNEGIVYNANSWVMLRCEWHTLNFRWWLWLELQQLPELRTGILEACAFAFFEGTIANRIVFMGDLWGPISFLYSLYLGAVHRPVILDSLELRNKLASNTKSC